MDDMRPDYPKIDWKKTADYLFGRSTLITIASALLLLISCYATWHGMRDFIVGVSATGATDTDGMSVPNDLLVVLVVVSLTFLMWLALRETFGSHRQIIERVITIPLYVFLAIWSIGFGYGFWWSLIAGEEATRTGLSALQEDARDASSAIAARLDAVRSRLDNVVSWSDTQMAREETSGGSCGTPSGAGRGPLYNARRGVRDSVTNLRDGMVKGWLNPVEDDIKRLNQNSGAINGGNLTERQHEFETEAATSRGEARKIADQSNELGRSTASEMTALAQSVSIAPGQPGFSCYDPTLADRLKQAAAQANQPVDITLRDVSFSEGPAGVANAVKHLWSNIGTYAYAGIAYVVTLGQVKIETKSGQPITGRDLIALLATIGIDFGLLALAALDPPAAAAGRRDALAGSHARLRLPSPAVISQLSNAFETAIAKAPDVDLDWVRRHFVHHGDCSYFVIPNLFGVAPQDQEEETRALAINQLAGVLTDLNLIRPLNKTELKRVNRAELQSSLVDLPAIERHHSRTLNVTKSSEFNWKKWLPEGLVGDVVEDRPRHHGLLSKAHRALGIAGWSVDAQREVEIFRLVDCDGLTPLLALFNAADLARGAEGIEAVRREQELLQAAARLQIADQRQSAAPRNANGAHHQNQLPP